MVSDRALAITGIVLSAITLVILVAPMANSWISESMAEVPMSMVELATVSTTKQVRVQGWLVSAVALDSFSSYGADYYFLAGSYGEPCNNYLIGMSVAPTPSIPFSGYVGQWVIVSGVVMPASTTIKGIPVNGIIQLSSIRVGSPPKNATAPTTLK